MASFLADIYIDKSFILPNLPLTPFFKTSMDYDLSCLDICDLDAHVTRIRQPRLAWSGDPIRPVHSLFLPAAALSLSHTHAHMYHNCLFSMPNTQLLATIHDGIHKQKVRPSSYMKV